MSSPPHDPGRPAIERDVDALRSDVEMAGMFFDDITEQLAAVEAGILALEQAPGDAGLLNDVFRPFHTIKGNAAVVGVGTVKEAAHRVEHLLDACRSGRRAFARAEADLVLEAIDVLRGLAADLHERVSGGAGRDVESRRQALLAKVAALGDGAPTPAPAAPAMPAAMPAAGVAAPRPPAALAATPQRDAGPVAATVKIGTRKLDHLVDMIGELVIAQAILQEDVASADLDAERLGRHLAGIRRVTADLQRTALALRMVPIGQTFQKMARLVRDVAHHTGKLVDLVLTGEDAELDRRIVEGLADPLMHMVRNSLDHGIETPDARVARGKAPQGRLALGAVHHGGSIVITLQDDGAGLDPARIARRAVERGLLAPDATPSVAELHQLIFEPGFSTAETVTDISGRGVGMDVVRRSIDALRGRVDVQSTPGEGTSFAITVPLTLATLDGLVLGVGRERFVVPTSAVRETFRPRPDQVHTVHGEPRLVALRGRLLPLLRLGEVFAVDAPARDVSQSVVFVLEDGGHAVGLVVDEVVGTQDVVIKALGDFIGPTDGIAGGAILGDGRVGLILDGPALVRRAARETSRAA